MDFYVLNCVVAMCLATYLPRALPIVLCTRKIQSRFIRSFLYYTPYAVLTALTFPAIFALCDQFWIGAVGAAVAIGFSLPKWQKLIVTVAISVLTVWILLLAT